MEYDPATHWRKKKFFFSYFFSLFFSFKSKNQKDGNTDFLKDSVCMLLGVGTELVLLICQATFCLRVI